MVDFFCTNNSSNYSIVFSFKKAKEYFGIHNPMFEIGCIRLPIPKNLGGKIMIFFLVFLGRPLTFYNCQSSVDQHLGT